MFFQKGEQARRVADVADIYCLPGGADEDAWHGDF
jgi:hypothetical protein